MSEVKRIPIKEFRKLGCLQEINRRLLHPCGLALEVVIDPETGEETLGGVWDYRDDPEGMLYSEEMLSSEKGLEKTKNFQRLFESKKEYREENFGYFIQPAHEVKGETTE